MVSYVCVFGGGGDWERWLAVREVVRQGKRKPPVVDACVYVCVALVGRKLWDCCCCCCRRCGKGEEGEGEAPVMGLSAGSATAAAIFLILLGLLLPVEDEEREEMADSALAPQAAAVAGDKPGEWAGGGEGDEGRLT